MKLYPTPNSKTAYLHFFHFLVLDLHLVGLGLQLFLQLFQLALLLRRKLSRRLLLPATKQKKPPLYLNFNNPIF